MREQEASLGKDTPIPETRPPNPKAELWDTQRDKWENVRDQVFRISEENLSPEEISYEQEHAEDEDFSEETLRQIFENPRSVIVMLKEGDNLVGYCYAIPDEDYKDIPTAYIYDLEIDTKHRGVTAIKPILETLRLGLETKGYQQITWDTKLRSNTIANLVRRFGGQIVESGPSSQEQIERHGLQTFYRIKL